MQGSEYDIEVNCDPAEAYRFWANPAAVAQLLAGSVELAGPVQWDAEGMDAARSYAVRIAGQAPSGGDDAARHTLLHVHVQEVAPERTQVTVQLDAGEGDAPENGETDRMMARALSRFKDQVETSGDLEPEERKRLWPPFPRTPPGATAPVL